MPCNVEEWRQRTAIDYQYLEDAILERMTDMDPTSDQWQSLAFAREVAERLRLNWSE